MAAECEGTPGRDQALTLLGQRVHLPDVIQATILDAVQQGAAGSATGDRRNNADFITIAEDGVLVVQKADVFAVDIEIEKAAQFVVFITQPVLEPWIAAIKGLDQRVDAVGLEGDAGLIVREFLKWGGDQDLDAHGGWVWTVMNGDGRCDQRVA